MTWYGKKGVRDLYQGDPTTIEGTRHARTWRQEMKKETSTIGLQHPPRPQGPEGYSISTSSNPEP
jgi:hypothetical protein